jgi:DsbC/DsbD-like thiol-disulfide interchange protein
VATLRHFAQRRKIGFPLLSDLDSKVIRSFGLFNETVPRGSLAWGVPHPGIYVIGADGIVTARYFEDDYRERFTIGGILTAHFGEEAPAAGSPVETAHLRIAPRVSSASPAVGHRITLVLDVEMKPKMHVYAPGAPEDYIAIRWDLDESKAYKAFASEFPAALRMTLAGETVPAYHGRFQVRRDVTVLGPPGDVAIQGSLRYQACDERQCFPPETVALQWTVRVAAFDRERAPVESRRPEPPKP